MTKNANCGPPTSTVPPPGLPVPNIPMTARIPTPEASRVWIAGTIADRRSIARSLVRSDGSEAARRPVPVDRGRGGTDGPAAACVGRPEDEDAVRLRRAPGLGAPELRHLAVGCDLVAGDAG